MCGGLGKIWGPVPPGPNMEPPLLNLQVRLLSILSVHIIKCAKLRALFAENTVRFARVEQLSDVEHRGQIGRYFVNVKEIVEIGQRQTVNKCPKLSCHSAIVGYFLSHVM